MNTTLSVVPGMQHVFPALSGRAPEADEEMQRIARWYRAPLTSAGRNWRRIQPGTAF